MTHVNKKNIPQEMREKAWKRFSAGKFLTPSEFILVEKRLLISLLLEQGFSYRKICEILDVTRVTISFVKHQLKRTPRVPRKYTPDNLRKKKMENKKSFLMSPAEHMRRMKWQG